ncbi:MAG TPA: sigma 54-interacting transcriptional regulator [Bryobacteraceae bacterium]|nr:sigma 54-interacting transcriptional regulator [Bryobacteraceae bacterium]
MPARILIVEDERITAEDLQDILTDLGYEVVDIVSSGTDAIRRAEEAKPDLALMDIRIKGDMDGTQVAAVLRSRFNIPVVYLTAHADAETLERAKVAQPLGYITKPFQEAELHANVEMALHKHREDLKARDREDVLASTLAALGEGVISTSVSGTVTLLNTKAEVWTGWSAREALGKKLDEVFPLVQQSTGQRLEEPLIRVLELGVIEEFGNGTVLLRKDGTQRAVEGSIAPIRSHEGDISGVVIVFGGAKTPAEQSQGAPASKEKDEDGIGLGDFKMVAASPRMKQVLRFAKRVAESEASTILLEGESGTGKDVVAQYMHHIGNRRNGPFVSLNCAAIPETLMESELFGYEKGAFTDARAPKAGIMEVASSGTIFLDEIGEMPIVLQAKLLRVLEDQRFRRLGGVRDIQVDLRVMAATNRKLVEAIDEGKFRLDLYYRLNVIQICLPALRERREDILPLARYFIQMYNTRFRRSINGLSRGAEQTLVEYEWPGNVRELRNMVERAMILEETDWIQPSSLQLEGRIQQTLAEGPQAGTLEQAERSLLVQALEKAEGNQTRAAVLLGISRDALRYKMKKFNLGRKGDGSDEGKRVTA